MVTANDQVREIFADARTLYADALEMLEGGKLRNAAEKASKATNKATDALILARTGEAPGSSSKNGRRLFELSTQDRSLNGLMITYDHRERQLYERCFYDGDCEPADAMERLIRETPDYIQAAEEAASG